MQALRFSVLFVVAVLTVRAQTSTSAISGTVTDASGAVVPNAAVSVTSDSTGVAYRQLTTGAGLYSFPALPVGAYTIAVEAPGFKLHKRSNNVLEVGNPLVADVQLEIGQSAETVSVVANLETIQTANAALGNVMARKAIVELPLNGRNPLNLLVLEPGVVQRTQGGAGTGMHVNGSRDFAFNTTIDGIEANESSVPNPTNNVFRLNPDIVQEYKVTTSNPTPEEGRNSGANVAVATRSGSNELHGTVFHFFRNSKLNANDFYANAQGTPRPDVKMNQYGFELGGPIVRNKTFFFGSWQGQKINFAQPIDQIISAPIVYTPEALAGRWRYFRVDPRNPFVLDGQTITRNAPQLVDRQTGQLRPGVRTCGSNTDLNCIATYNMFAADPRRIGGDPTILKLLSQYPAPNSYVAGDGLNTAAFLWNAPAKIRGPHILARVDHSFNANNTVFARYLFGDQNTIGGDPLNSRPQVFPNFPPLGEVFRRSHNLAVSWRRVLSPRMVNELTLGFSRFYFLFTQGEANPDFPNVAPYDFLNITDALLNRPRTNRALTTPQILDNLSLIAGAHQWKMGFNFRFYQHNDQRGQPGGVNVTPVLSFSQALRLPQGFNTPAPATATAGGINAQDNTNLLQGINELLGIPARLTQVFLGDLKSDQFLPFKSGNSVTLWAQGQRLRHYNFYFQDEWKLRRNMTLNYGARWEANPAPTEAGGRVYVPNGSLIGGSTVSFTPARRWYARNNLGAVAPRLGLTWSPGASGRTVVRAGYGIAFDPIASFQITAVAGRVPGLTTTCQSNPGAATSQGCQAVPDLRVNEGFPQELQAPTTKPSSFLTPPRQVLTGAPAITVFDQNLKVPTVHMWNLTLAGELPHGFILQSGYLGKRGTRLFRAYDLNQINADPILAAFRAMQRNVNSGCNAAGANCPAGVNGSPISLVTSGIVPAAFLTSAATAGELQQNAAGNFAGRLEQTTLAAGLRPNQQFGIITYLDAGGDSYYHAWQTTLRRRFANGFQVMAAYTLSKSIDNQSVDPVASSAGGGLTTTTSRAPADTRNWRDERGVSDFDRRHVFTGIWLYELPLARGATGVWKHALGGWSVNGTFTAYTGEPFTVLSGVRTSNFSHVSRAVFRGEPVKAEYQEAANKVGPVYFRDASAFTFPAAGDNGMGRNLFRAAGYWNTDMGLQKVFPVTDRVRMQFRIETFNTLNHPSFESPTSSTSGSNQITNTRFGEACCQAVAPNTTQNIIQTGESARGVQLALKLIF